MIPSRRTLLLVLALVIGISLAVVLVRAATPGENFEWLAVTEGGILIGGSVGEGEGEAEPPTSNTLTFVDPPAPDSSAVVFSDEGAVGTMNQQGHPEAALALVTEAFEGELEEGEVAHNSSGLLMGGDAGIMSGYFDESFDFVPASAVFCTLGGDVVVQLGYAAEGEGEESMMAGQGGTEFSESSGASSLREMLERIPRRIPIPWPASAGHPGQ